MLKIKGCPAGLPEKGDFISKAESCLFKKNNQSSYVRAVSGYLIDVYINRYISCYRKQAKEPLKSRKYTV